MPPNDVGVTIGGGIADAADAPPPSAVAADRQEAAADHLVVAQVPGREISTGIEAPHDIAVSVAVDVTRAAHLPIEVGVLADAERSRIDDRGAHKVPRSQRAVRLVPP